MSELKSPSANFHTKDPAPTIVLEPLDKSVEPAALIFLHGLGGSAKDMLSFAKAWQAVFPFLKIILPNAPSGPVTMNFGFEMPCWHDVIEFATLDCPPEGWAGANDSLLRLLSEVDKEISSGSTPAHRLVVGGFSQGGAMALHVGYHGKKHLIGGIFALSGYTLFDNYEEARDHICASLNVKTPVFVGHGTIDNVVVLEAAKKTVACMKDAGTPVEFTMYPKMGHTVNSAAFDDVTKFLRRVFKYDGAGSSASNASTTCSSTFTTSSSSPSSSSSSSSPPFAVAPSSSSSSSPDFSARRDPNLNDPPSNSCASSATSTSSSTSSSSSSSLTSTPTITRDAMSPSPVLSSADTAFPNASKFETHSMNATPERG